MGPAAAIVLHPEDPFHAPAHVGIVVLEREPCRLQHERAQLGGMAPWLEVEVRDQARADLGVVVMHEPLEEQPGLAGPQVGQRQPGPAGIGRGGVEAHAARAVRGLQGRLRPVERADGAELLDVAPEAKTPRRASFTARWPNDPTSGWIRPRLAPELWRPPQHGGRG